MATDSSRARPAKMVEYPTRDGKPIGETEPHRVVMVDLIQTLQLYYAAQPMAYVSGNLMMYYVEGNKRKHVSPDIFVTLGVPKHVRDYYLLWVEGKPPDLVVELTSPSTRNEDVHDKFFLYQDVLKVPEYFLFDPRSEYLTPRLQGFRRVDERYQPIATIDGRLPSDVLKLHLEGHHEELRLYNPADNCWLLTPAEVIGQERMKRQQAESELTRVEARAEQMANENARLLAELEKLRADRG